MRTIDFRKANVNDLELLVELRYEMLREVNHIENLNFSDDFMRATENYFSSDKQSTYIATEGKGIIACATICYTDVMPTFDHPNGRRARIMNVYTRNEYRRRGIAFRLLDMAVQEAEFHGVTEISLDATDDGRELYISYGFKPSDEYMVLTFDKED